MPDQGCDVVEEMQHDGWLRKDYADWSGLWFVSADGWSPMPSHGHEDCGSFELHFRGLPIIIDPGRGRYGNDSLSRKDVTCGAHNCLLIDGQGAFPVNRPYYSSEFRRIAGGKAPMLYDLSDGVEIDIGGYADQKAIEKVERRWLFSTQSMELRDRIVGRGRIALHRVINTPLPATLVGEDAVELDAADFKVILTARHTTIEIKDSERWTAYGRGQAATRINFIQQAELPADLRLRMEVR
jgi:hypothetical protein